MLKIHLKENQKTLTKTKTIVAEIVIAAVVLKKDEWEIASKQNALVGIVIFQVKLRKSTVMVHLVLRLKTEKRKNM